MFKYRVQYYVSIQLGFTVIRSKPRDCLQTCSDSRRESVKHSRNETG